MTVKIGSLVSSYLKGVSRNAYVLKHEMKTFRWWKLLSSIISSYVDVRDSSRSLKAYIRDCSLLEEKYANDTARERVLNAMSARSSCVFVIPSTASDSRTERGVRE